MNHHLPASFAADGSVVAAGDGGQLAHRATFDQMVRLEERLYTVDDGIWCLVGNGLSNQTFVRGPDGLIAIDTGESVEEMAAALTALRAHTDEPVVAVIYSHFHYCNGTTALSEEDPTGGTSTPLPVWGHERIEANLARMATEVSTAAARGLVHQFGVLLPPDGPDGLVGVGLGRFFKNPAHGSGTSGYVAPTEIVTEPTTATIAGLQVELSPAPSDADDSLNIFFPELGLCVNNLAWPALFNVFAIRGEEYRDPRILLSGFDEIIDFEPGHLVCTHGPPLSGRDEIQAALIDARGRGAVPLGPDRAGDQPGSTVGRSRRGRATARAVRAIVLHPAALRSGRAPRAPDPRRTARLVRRRRGQPLPIAAGRSSSTAHRGIRRARRRGR